MRDKRWFLCRRAGDGKLADDELAKALKGSGNKGQTIRQTTLLLVLCTVSTLNFHSPLNWIRWYDTRNGTGHVMERINSQFSEFCLSCHALASLFSLGKLFFPWCERENDKKHFDFRDSFTNVEISFVLLISKEFYLLLKCCQVPNIPN